MRTSRFLMGMFLASVAASGISQVQADDAKTPYPTMAPLDQYLIADVASEVALARTAAPASVSDGAEVMVLSKAGYITAAKGTDGFVCVVERGWGAGTTDPNFWNPKVRAPTCFNAAAARSFLPIYLMKTKLLLAGKSKAEILAATDAAFVAKQLPTLEAGAMCYMMSKQQYLSDDAPHSWHPHVMVFASGDAEKSWGANLPDSPIIAANDPEERATIFMIPVSKWSDGTPGPAMHH
jgi:hypothetical protein